jgi:tRNA-specific 2-thiouridylase
MRFPLGDLVKGRVRELAAEAGLSVAGKADSQDLCFLAGTGRAAFLARHGGQRERAGDILDRRGRVLGRHRGHQDFTVGQRRGLGVGGGDPLFVLATDARANTVTVGRREALATRTVALRDITLHRPADAVDQIKLRYRSPAMRGALVQPAPAGHHETLDVRLREPVPGAAPGQLATLMHGDLIVGHGTIASYTPDRDGG